MDKRADTCISTCGDVATRIHSSRGQDRREEEKRKATTEVGGEREREGEKR